MVDDNEKILNDKALVISHDTELVNSTKEIMEGYFKQLREPTKLFLKNQFAVEKNKCGNSVPVIQAGVTIWESSKETHWVMATPKLLPEVKPPQYAYCVRVLNPKTSFFDTVYPVGNDLASEAKCMEYVLRWQEAKYGFSFKEKMVAERQLANIVEQLGDFQHIVGEDYAKEFQDRVDVMQEEVRKELGIIE